MSDIDSQGFAWRTGGGVTASTATATFVTLFTPATPGLYLVGIYIPGSGALYQGAAVVAYDGAASSLLRKDVGALVDFQLSGIAVQAKQTSGTSSTISYAYLLIA